MQEANIPPKAASAVALSTGLSIAEVTRRRDVTHDLWVVWLRPSLPFTFKPGQYCTIGLNGVERAYSIVSAPHEPELEVFIELVPHGELTPPLYTLQVGDQVTLRPRAKGIFTLDPSYVSHVMVSTVTGIAPFVSMLRDHLYRGQKGHRFYVLQGASYQHEFTYAEELAGMARQHPDFITYVPTVSRPQEAPNASWSGEAGRVNLLVEHYLEQWQLGKQDTLVYACGHPGMIEDVKQRFIPQGWKVKEERFWKA
ncbi:MAG: ferredoxin--NADP reductase [Chloroflexi bacterium]|nr:ferredoxin--NADP reductase [Chloroflexota bacterium]